MKICMNIEKYSLVLCSYLIMSIHFCLLLDCRTPVRESMPCSCSIGRSCRMTGHVQWLPNKQPRQASVRVCSHPDVCSMSSVTSTNAAANASGGRTIVARRTYGRSHDTSLDLDSSYEECASCGEGDAVEISELGATFLSYCIAVIFCDILDGNYVTASEKQYKMSLVFSKKTHILECRDVMIYYLIQDDVKYSKHKLIVISVCVNFEPQIITADWCKLTRNVILFKYKLHKLIQIL